MNFKKKGGRRVISIKSQDLLLPSVQIRSFFSIKKQNCQCFYYIFLFFDLKICLCHQLFHYFDLVLIQIKKLLTLIFHALHFSIANKSADISFIFLFVKKIKYLSQQQCSSPSLLNFLAFLKYSETSVKTRKQMQKRKKKFFYFKALKIFKLEKKLKKKHEYLFSTRAT